MALIKCPDCGQDISSKAKTCIHCGYPIAEYIVSMDMKNEELVNLVFVSSYNEKKTTGWMKRIFQRYGVPEARVQEILCNPGATVFYGLSSQNAEYMISIGQQYGGCYLEMVKSSCVEADEINIKITEVLKEREKLQESIQSSKARKTYNDDEPVKCPRCSSTSITTGQRGFSIVWGFIGSGNTVNRCARCGHSWKPK